MNSSDSENDIELTRRKTKKRFTIKFKRDCIKYYEDNDLSITDVSNYFQIDKKNLSKWLIQKDKILSSTKAPSKLSVGGQGRKTILYFESELLMYVKECRDKDLIVTTYDGRIGVLRGIILGLIGSSESPIYFH